MAENESPLENNKVEVEFNIEPEVVKEEQTSKYVGVRGWLLFFCIWLVAFIPLFNFLAVIPVFEQSLNIEKVMSIELLLQIAVLLISMLAGLALWIKMKNAIKIAKIALFTILLRAPVISFAIMDPSTDMYRLRLNTLVGALYFAIWYSYLKKSKRVKATYKLN